jgi:hypothetical protein
MRRCLWSIYASLVINTAAAANPWITAVTTITHNLLLLPPAIRLGLGGEQELLKDCKAATVDNFIWARDATHGHQVVTEVFRRMASETSSFTMWFPSFSDNDVLQELTRVLNDNANRLGGLTVQAKAWPKAPCHGLHLARSLTWPSECLMAEISTELSDESAISATRVWVEHTLCRLSLCPYTVSLSRAAVGLESANVNEGPVLIRPPLFRSNSPAAALLAATFWEGVSEIARTPEEEVATSLLIAPAVYDDKFVEFAAVCDDLIEASVQVVRADQIVGRAWFHPYYDAACVGHTTIIPGHALPATMVQGFIDTTMSDSTERPSLERLAQANDAVRRTPHATINLLRRTQLAAAKRVEASSTNKKPNAIYARNVMKILADQKLGLKMKE